MRFAVLGSGSKGNSLVVQGEHTTVLVDVGYTAKEIRKRLRQVGLDDLRGLNGLLITHGHNDHVKGAKALAGGMRLRTFATEQTQRFCARRTALQNHVPVEPGRAFTVGELSVTPFATVHDAKGSCGFVLTDGHVRLGICTDLGCVTDEVVQALSGLDALYLEFNHDEDMLRNGPYPAHLKRRILSRYGHLSNDDAGFLLHKVKGPQLGRVVLGHLSETNNTERHAIAAAQKAIGDDPIAIVVAPQSHPSAWWEVHKGSTTAGPRPEVLEVEVPPTLQETAAAWAEAAEPQDAEIIELTAQRRGFVVQDVPQERRGRAMRDALFGPPPADDAAKVADDLRKTGREIAQALSMSWSVAPPASSSAEPPVCEPAPMPVTKPAPRASTSTKSETTGPGQPASSQPVSTELPGVEAEPSAEVKPLQQKAEKPLAVRRQLTLFGDEVEVPVRRRSR